MNNGDILGLIASLEDEQRLLLLHDIRIDYPIHNVENEWNASAETILEAIHRSGPLNQRAVKGMLAEANFKRVLQERWSQFNDITPEGDLEYDYKINCDGQDVRIQVKNQRSEKGSALILDTRSNKGAYAVETQRTRNGLDAEGNPTRFYCTGSFDILAVCLYASSGSWTHFTFTLERWLLHHNKRHGHLAAIQPMHITGQSAWSGASLWTEDLAECIEWLKSERSGCVSL